MNINEEKDRQVETRLPLDPDKSIREITEEINEMARHRLPTEEERANILAVVVAGSLLCEKIVRTIPEGVEKEIALNNIRSSILWVKHGVLKRSVEIVQP